jgi:hypothetical protein
MSWGRGRFAHSWRRIVGEHDALLDQVSLHCPRPGSVGSEAREGFYERQHHVELVGDRPVVAQGGGVPLREELAAHHRLLRVEEGADFPQLLLARCAR